MIPKDHLFDFMLIHADTSLIISQRLSEWCGHGPVLEQDMAMTNLALDHIGRARLLYQYASELENAGRSEDELAFLRDELDYKNLLLAEYPNTDFAFTVTRQFFLDAFYIDLLDKLSGSADSRLAHIANKSLKETQYHYKWSSDWMIRLGDGTEISHEKVQNAVDRLWEYTGEIFQPAECELGMMEAGVAPSYEELSDSWHQRVNSVLAEATLKKPQSTWQQKGGKTGHNTEHLGYLLAEMQYMQRAYPGLDW